jgi:hypothetical protein
MLNWILIIPLLGCLLLLPIDEQLDKNKSKIKQIALSISLITFLISIIIWILFDNSTTQYQFVSEFTFLKFCQFHIGIDGISLYFVLLTTFITPLCILASWNDIKTNLKYYYILFLLLETLQIGVFVMLDLLLFYIFFESVLIPLFLIIITWGASEAKTRAAYLLFLYTLFGSLFMLLAILTILYNFGSTDFLYISLSDISLENQKILFLAFFISFAIKTPLVPAHLWLFRAHAEAPLAGSVILAAIILKLATYGYLRILIPLFGDALNYFLPWIQSIGIITLIYASLATIRQSDLKQWIAYSSVAQPNGPLNIFYLLSQTICGKPKDLNPNYLSTNIIYENYINFSYNNFMKNWILVKILNNYLGNPQITKTYLNLYDFNLLFSKLNNLLNMLVGISETRRLFSANIIILFNSIINSYNLNNNESNLEFNVLSSSNNKNLEQSDIIDEKQFYEWLAGLIDGDGYFYIRKPNRLTYLIITFDIRDKKTAEMIKDRIGGNISLVTGKKAVRYRLYNQEDILLLLNKLNGLIRTPTRIEQLKQSCLKYGIEFKNPINLEFKSAWFSGFFDADGHISYNKNKKYANMNICITQKYKEVLEELSLLYNGRIYNHSRKNNAYRFIISRKDSIITILNFYFNINPSRTIKQNRLMLIKFYYELIAKKAHKASKESLLNKEWVNFQKNWLNK